MSHRFRRLRRKLQKQRAKGLRQNQSKLMATTVAIYVAFQATKKWRMFRRIHTIHISLWHVALPIVAVCLSVRGTYRWLLNTRHRVINHLHLNELAQLSFIQRLVHHTTRRHLLGFGIGFCIMLIGSTIAQNASVITGIIPIPHVTIDAVGYFLHGAGAIPMLSRIEPLWKIFTAADK